MAIGIPTICILSNLNWIREEARNDYKKLIDGKILFINPKDASDHINKVYYNVENWWNNKQVQEIRKIFCDKYSKPAPINSLKQIASTLKNIV
jgi:putative transferase (TIGR04331 family)